MTALLNAVPRREKKISTPGLKGLAYSEQIGLRRTLEEHPLILLLACRDQL
jgi:hypothetical protein